MSQNYDVVIEFDEFITRAELNTILTEIELAIESYLLRQAGLSPLENRQLGGTYLKIRTASSGSIIIVVSAFIAGFLAPSFRKGWRKGQAVKETQRIGKTLSDVMGAALRPIRKALERLEQRLREEKSRVTRLTVRPSTTVISTGINKNKPSKPRRSSARSRPLSGTAKAALSIQHSDMTLKRDLPIKGPLRLKGSKA